MWTRCGHSANVCKFAEGHRATQVGKRQPRGVLPPTLLTGHSSLPADIAAQVAEIVEEAFAQLRTNSDLLYPQAYLAQLFRNQKNLIPPEEKQTYLA